MDSDMPVSHFDARSADIRALVSYGARIGTCHPRYLCDFDAVRFVLTSAFLLPCFVFDPAGISTDTGVPIRDYCNHVNDCFDATYRHIRIEQLFPNSYTYHWHNQWHRPLIEPSIAGRLFLEVDDAFRQRT